MLTQLGVLERSNLFAGVCVMSAIADVDDSADPAPACSHDHLRGQEISVLPYNGDQYYASVPDVVSLCDHFQIPTSTLTSTDLNGGNVMSTTAIWRY